MFRRVTIFALVILLLPGMTVLAAPKDSPDAGIKLLEDFQNIFISLADRVKPTVVNIAPQTGGPHPSQPDEGPRESPRAPEAPPGSGSGVIVDKRGFIVTNNHVVGDADEVEVRLSDKTKFTGKVVGKDPDTDLALIKIEATKDLPFATMGDSTKIKVGQWVIAVGNPFGLDRTVTVGVVSALGRENVNLSRYEDFIQTDASINPGNSGGPLFNIRGEVIGINTAIINFAQGIGFAIPSNMVEAITAQLMEKGKVTRGWLGVGIQPLTPELASKFGVKENEGVLVNEVFDGDPASRAGILPGDIILKVEELPVDTPNSLARVIASLIPGKKANIEIMRDGKKKTIVIELVERKDEAVTAAIPRRPEVFLGLNVQDLTPEIAERFKLKEEKGVIVTKVEPGSAAEAEGLKEGDLIKEVNREKVDSTDEFKKIMEKTKKTEAVLLRISRENRAFFIVLKPGDK
ncbi:DegQ family serine endoprotease [Candidatus Manganitrophus noduliformans]|uniref:DegQ family serine endoprotease n=1 Tax=Candidatus Manganitrophus noduliformans TaxID=2606439 RepID=A0A7X6ICH0_9BACT|nr:DegQ family serine endoprotease [Candidatus Manganitrophus noduliformans]NKE72444.1 DegQ family serine endoprotease [Candidatus Manganitrophus noduliformans]